MSFSHSIATALLSIYPRVMKTYIHIRTLVVKGQIPRPTHNMTFKQNAVPSITWRRMSVCNTSEGHLLRLCWVEKVNLQRLHSCWPIYITVTKVQSQWADQGARAWGEEGSGQLQWDGATLPEDPRTYSEKLDRTKHTYTRTSSIWAQTF